MTAGIGGGSSSGSGQLVQQFNETSANINAGATFNGAAHDTGKNDTAPGAGYSRFRVSAFLDQAGTINVQQSRDGVTWRATLTPQSVPANSDTVVESIVTMRYVRATLTNNGGVATTVVALDSCLLAI